MTDKKLLEDYINYFGDEPPFPPEHIMKTLVEMKRNGIYDEKMEEFESFKDEVVGQIEDVSGEKLSLDHPLFDIDFTEDRDYDTLGGYIFFSLEKIPDKGESVTFNNWNFKVMTLLENRIQKVQVKKNND